MTSQFEKVKSHFRENRVIYITATAGVAVGAGVALIATKQVVVVDSFKIQWKTSTINNVTTVLTRRGHPGYMVRCIETGEVFASINRAADVMGISSGSISKHLRGIVPNAGGLTFENLGEMQ